MDVRPGPAECMAADRRTVSLSSRCPRAASPQCRRRHRVGVRMVPSAARTPDAGASVAERGSVRTRTRGDDLASRPARVRRHLRRRRPADQYGPDASRTHRRSTRSPWVLGAGTRWRGAGWRRCGDREADSPSRHRARRSHRSCVRPMGGGPEPGREARRLRACRGSRSASGPERGTLGGEFLDPDLGTPLRQPKRSMESRVRPESTARERTQVGGSPHVNAHRPLFSTRSRC